MQTSSRVRASDIESRLASLSEAMSRLDHKHKLRFVAAIKETLVPDSSKNQLFIITAVSVACFYS